MARLPPSTSSYYGNTAEPEGLAETEQFIENKLGLQTRYANYGSLDIIVPPEQTDSVMNEIRYICLGIMLLLVWKMMELYY